MFDNLSVHKVDFLAQRTGRFIAYHADLSYSFRPECRRSAENQSDDFGLIVYPLLVRI